MRQGPVIQSTLLRLSITSRLWSSKFNQPFCFSLLSITRTDLLENNDVWLNWGQKVMFVRCDRLISIHFVGFCIFRGQVVVFIIMIDGSKIHKSLAGIEVQSPYVIERRSKDTLLLQTPHYCRSIAIMATKCFYEIEYLTAFM